MAAGSAEVILAAVDSILKYAGAPISAYKQCCRQSEMRTAGERCFHSLIASRLRRAEFEFAAAAQWLAATGWRGSPQKF